MRTDKGIQHKISVPYTDALLHNTNEPQDWISI